MIGIGIIEIILSQIPNFHKLSVLSIIAASMAFGYASIGVGLSLTTVIQGQLVLLLINLSLSYVLSKLDQIPLN